MDLIHPLIYISTVVLLSQSTAPHYIVAFLIRNVWILVKEE